MDAVPVDEDVDGPRPDERRQLRRVASLTSRPRPTSALGRLASSARSASWSVAYPDSTRARLAEHGGANGGRSSVGAGQTTRGRGSKSGSVQFRRSFTTLVPRSTRCPPPPALVAVIVDIAGAPGPRPSPPCPAPPQRDWRSASRSGAAARAGVSCRTRRDPWPRARAHSVLEAGEE